MIYISFIFSLFYFLCKHTFKEVWNLWFSFFNLFWIWFNILTSAFARFVILLWASYCIGYYRVSFMTLPHSWQRSTMLLAVLTSHTSLWFLTLRGFIEGWVVSAICFACSASSQIKSLLWRYNSFRIIISRWWNAFLICIFILFIRRCEATDFSLHF